MHKNVSNVTSVLQEVVRQLRQSNPDHQLNDCVAKEARLANQISGCIAEIEQLSNFFEMSLDLFLIVDFSGQIKVVNSAFLSVLGYSESDIISKPFIDLVHPEDIEPSMKEVEKLSYGAVTINFENRYRTKTGQYIDFRWNVAPNRQTSMLYCCAREITGEKKMLSKLLQSAKMSSLGEMAGGIAHEVNNPLAIIYGKAAQITKRIKSGILDADWLENELGKIGHTVERIAKTIRSLRSFSRDVEGDPMELADIQGIISETIELCKERFKAKSIDLIIDCPLDAKIECRPVQLSQILLNLLNNSYDAIEKEAEKWIKINIEFKLKSVLIVITDSGHGIPSGIAEKMMQPFYTTKGTGKGTGLGLSLSKGLAEDHGGTLTYNRDSKNTQFVLELPIKNENTYLMELKSS